MIKSPWGLKWSPLQHWLKNQSRLSSWHCKCQNAQKLVSSSFLASCGRSTCSSWGFSEVLALTKVLPKLMPQPLFRGALTPQHFASSCMFPHISGLSPMFHQSPGAHTTREQAQLPSEVGKGKALSKESEQTDVSATVWVNIRFQVEELLATCPDSLACCLPSPQRLFLSLFIY